MQYASMISVESPAVAVTRRSGSRPHAARRRRRRAGRRRCSPRAAAAAAPTSNRSRGCRTAARRRTTTVRRLRRRTCSNSRSTSGTTSRRTTVAARATATRAGKRRCSRAATTSTSRMPPPTASSRLASPPDSMMVTQGRRRSQLLAREQRRVRRHLDDLDHELGRRDVLDGRAQDRARAAGAARPRPEQELPGRPRRAVLDDRVSAAHAALRGLPRVGHGAEAAAVLRRKRAPPDDADALAIAYEAAKSKMNLDDPAISRFVLRLRNESHNCWTTSCANDANAMQTAIQNFAQRRAADVRRSELDHEQGHDALRGHDRLGRQPLRSERHRAVRVQDGPRLRHVDHGRLLDCLRHERRRPGHGPDAVRQRAVVRRLGLELRRR